MLYNITATLLQLFGLTGTGTSFEHKAMRASSTPNCIQNDTVCSGVLTCHADDAFWASLHQIQPCSSELRLCPQL